MDQLGLQAVFKCEISRPELKAEWFKGKKAIKRSDKYDITAAEGRHTLTISDCQGEDVSEYTVKLNGVSSTAKLAVNGKIEQRS